MGYLLGICAFVLFFISDYNDWRPFLRWGKFLFPAGVVLLCAGTVLEARMRTPITSGWLRDCVFALLAAFAALLVYTLFFALPVESSYTRPGEKRLACTTGVYALCRHPGVLWFAGLFLCIWLGFGLPLWEAALYSGCNVLLVLFEDRCVFPARLEGYGRYQRTTPFLIPNAASIRAALGR